MSLLGTLSGTLRRPSMSSEKQIEPRLDAALGQHLEGVAHHGGAGDLAEGADVRQAGGAVARLEDDGLVGGARELLEPLDDLARLLERPGARLRGDCNQRGVEALCHGRGPYLPLPAPSTQTPPPPSFASKPLASPQEEGRPDHRPASAASIALTAAATAARRRSRSRRSACRRGRRGTCGSSSPARCRHPGRRAPSDRRGAHRAPFTPTLVVSGKVTL